MRLLKECGIDISNGVNKLKADASNFPIEVFFLRDDDIPQYVQDGVADIGFVGENVVYEKAKKVELDDLQTCEACGAYFPKAIDVCPECQTEVVKKEKVINKIESNLITTPIKKIPTPNPEKIYLYTLSINEDLNFAYRIMINQTFDLFRYYRVSKEQYLSNLNDGRLDKKILEIVKYCYSIFNSKHDLVSGVHRTHKYLINKIKEKLANYYGN
jgi:hypothetical protein